MDEPAKRDSGSQTAERRGEVAGPAVRASLQASWRAFKRLTQLGFPPRFPILQFPNVPLILAFVAGEAAKYLNGSAHTYAAATAYVALAIWAYEELVHGVNWFRQLLGLAYVIIVVVRIAHALH
jgi:hypothetical protein